MVTIIAFRLQQSAETEFSYPVNCPITGQTRLSFADSCLLTYLGYFETGKLEQAQRPGDVMIWRFVYFAFHVLLTF